MGQACPTGTSFASYREAVSWTQKNQPSDISDAEAYFASILGSRLAASEKLALLWCYSGQNAEKGMGEVEWTLSVAQGALERQWGSTPDDFPLLHAFHAVLRVLHPTYSPQEAISFGLFTAFTVFVPQVRQFIHGSYSVRDAGQLGRGEQEFEVFKFLRSLQKSLRKTPIPEKAEVLQRGIRHLPAQLKIPLRRRLASNEAPIGWHEFCKWLSACPSLAAARIPKSDSNPRSVVDERVADARKQIDETFQFLEEFSKAQLCEDEEASHHKPASVRDILVQRGVIPAEVVDGLELCGIGSLTEGAFMLLFVPPSLWEADPVCALDMLGNFRRAVLHTTLSCEPVPKGAPKSGVVESSTFTEGFPRNSGEFDVEDGKNFIAGIKRTISQPNNFQAREERREVQDQLCEAEERANERSESQERGADERSEAEERADQRSEASMERADQRSESSKERAADEQSEAHSDYAPEEQEAMGDVCSESGEIPEEVGLILSPVKRLPPLEIPLEVLDGPLTEVGRKGHFGLKGADEHACRVLKASSPQRRRQNA